MEVRRVSERLGMRHRGMAQKGEKLRELELVFERRRPRLTICAKIGIMSRSSRVNVPIPDELLADIRLHPEVYGVAELTSEAGRLQRIFQTGAEAARRRVEEALMAQVYDAWASDKEREQAIADLSDVLFAEGGELDILLSQAPTPDA